MDEQPTCGKGLAEHAMLQATLGELAAAVGRILELHMEALPEDDPATRDEYHVYQRFVAEHTATADALRATAGAMAACIDMPAAPHDMAVMADPRHADAFRRFIAAEESLLALLTTRLDQDRAMLEQMRSQEH